MIENNENELYERLIKIKDFILPDLIAIDETAKTFIREVTRGNNVTYYYIIEKQKQEGNDNIRGYIEYNDLIETIKILFFLNSNIEIDTSTLYMENQWEINSVCDIGNYVRDKKMRWYIDIHLNEELKGVLKFEEVETLCKAFVKAKKAIEKLKE